MTPAARSARSGGHRGSAVKSAGTVEWRDAAPAPVVLVLGPEDYIAARSMDAIRAKARSASPDLEVTKLEAGTYSGGELLMAASPSLFGENKLVEVQGLESMSEEFLRDTLAYVSAPENDVVLVLRHAGGAKGKKLLDAVKASGAPVIDCQPLKKDADKAAFVAAEFRGTGRRIEREAIDALVAAVGSSLAELAAACSQLALDASATVDAATVEKYYGGRVEATAFKVADAALAGQQAKALSAFRHALETGVDPVPMVAAIASKLRTLAKVAGARGSAQSIARELGMQPWLVEQAQRDIRGWTPQSLATAIRAVAEADAEVKGLARDPGYAVERALSIVSSAARAR
ncbi:DNA polymerase III subunit delta [Sinomonas sp. ASV486]|uniref:DNA polymerase III subunit delta n=1 Tax=Sinomonas sp. ASV486 TaxID=3051170 RepID=UPI0027DD3FA8|nr:DNA polymerase III subunit delta [Sinomonas sp. ASV486]MDQ4491444.1 DNA polymerase III subunit delta [Sinomonas sp. ASV486]